MIAFTDIIRRYFLVVLAFFVAIFFLVRRYLKTETGKQKFDDFLIRVPAIGNFLRLIYLSRFAENLATLISGGLPIAKALEIAASVVSNHHYYNIIMEARDEVRKGDMISKTLKKYPKDISAFFSQMVLVGERTGRLSETLMYVVNFYQKEIEQGAEGLLNLLEPLMIVVLGGMVGLLIAAILLPLYQMGTT